MIPVLHERVRHWQAPFPAEILTGFLTVGFMKPKGFRFLLIGFDGKVKISRSVPDSLLAGIVDDQDDPYAVLQTGKLWKLSDIVWNE
jgi:hypothetical protein